MEVEAGMMRVIYVDRRLLLILCFLIINLAFAIMELLYGIWANSLGLVSDAFHMLFDSTALFAGLVASVISKWHPNDAYSYGYVRAEAIAGFGNCIFLMFIAFFVFSEALQRLVQPQEVKNEHLVHVSVVCLAINIIGLFVVQHDHDDHEESRTASVGSRHYWSSMYIQHSGQDQKKINFNLSDEIQSTSGHTSNQEVVNSDNSVTKRGSRDAGLFQVSSGHTRNLSYQPHDQVDSPHDQIDNPHSQVDNPHSQVDSLHSQVDSLHSQVDSIHSLVDNSHSKSDLYDHHQNYSSQLCSTTRVPLSAKPSQKGIMQGMFLHVLADTLGSVGVVISSFLVSQFGLTIADTLCSMLISCLIIVSVYPLLQDSIDILMQRTPHELQMKLPLCYQRVSHLEGVYNIGESHFWTVCTDEYVGTIKLEVGKHANSQYILEETYHIFNQAGVGNLTVQIDYEED